MVKWLDFVLFSTLLAGVVTSYSSDIGQFDPDHYYILETGGSYKYGHQRQDGTYEKAEASQSGNVVGEFGFRDASGTDYKLEYTADHRGFQPTGDHLPRPVPSVHTKAAPENPGAGFISSDGGYTFNYETDSSAREETADPNLNVRGRFSFRGTDGRQRTVQYRAGADSGFVAQGDHLPVSPDVPSGSAAVPQTRSGPAAPSYSAPSSPAQVKSSSSPDGSYSFNYETDSSAREETADPNLNVRGRFSFRGTDGRQRTVQYRAGADSGFVAQGEHLPISPDVPSGSQGVPQTRSGPSVPSPSSSHSSSTQVRSFVMPDGSYNFNYETDTSAREESADPDLNVKGRFSFRANDGQQRIVQYKAGAGIGFVAKGDHLPISEAGTRSFPTIEGGYKFGYETDSSTREENADQHLNIRGRYSFQGDDGIQRVVLYKAGADTGFLAEGDHLPVVN